MNMGTIQEMLRTVRSGQIQQILAAVLAIITAIGGLGVVGSSNGGGEGSAISVPGVTDEGTPAPSGKSVPLATVVDSGEAHKGTVEIGGKEYPDSWTFARGASHRFYLNGEYNTLTATIVELDVTASPHLPKTFTLGNETYELGKKGSRKNITLDVRDVSDLVAVSSGLAAGGFALVDARLY